MNPADNCPVDATRAPAPPRPEGASPAAGPGQPGGRLRTAAAVLVLGLGTAILVGAEFVPAGVLPALAADLGVSEGTAGLAVAATAFAGALTAPTIAALVPRMDRRNALLLLLALAVASNVAVALAPTFAVVVAARLVLGVSIAGFWAFAFGVGVAVTGRPALVSTTLALGTGLATIVGVPLASVLGDLLGWRLVFGAVAALSVVMGVAVALLLPRVPADPAAGLAMMRAALRNPRLVVGVGVIALAVFSNFLAYPYIRLLIEAVDPGAVALLLLAWGLGGLAGNLLGGGLSRWLRWVTAAGPALLAVALLGVTVAGSVPVLALALVAWGIGFNMFPVTTQLWVSAVEPRRSESAISLQVTAFQVAITLGSVIGGRLVDASGPMAAVQLGMVTAALAALGFACIKVSPRRD